MQVSRHDAGKIMFVNKQSHEMNSDGGCLFNDYLVKLESHLSRVTSKLKTYYKNHN